MAKKRLGHPVVRGGGLIGVLRAFRPRYEDFQVLRWGEARRRRVSVSKIHGEGRPFERYLKLTITPRSKHMHTINLQRANESRHYSGMTHKVLTSPLTPSHNPSRFRHTS